eukprot:TRINITY_DN40092_c0_g1_i2.p1 TRINITY_DN40092_c0_g1~~TRINITY_DN40092_c0_g1_i2.p1  ORF type:complete len:367 (-),score=33.38 TRINITY_DN40092_c0_g1_i2:360-1460(-)
MDALLVSLVEFDGGERMIGFCHALAVARLARASTLLAHALKWETTQSVIAALPMSQSTTDAVESRNAVTAGLRSESLIAAAGTDVARGLVPEPSVLSILCRLSERSTVGAQASDGLDQLCQFLAQGLDPGPTAASWARALRCFGVADLLERHCEKQFGRSIPDRQPAGSSDALFDAIFDGSLCRVVNELAEGASLQASGAAMLNGDPGCCRWSPLAAACHVSSRRRHGAEMVALLLAARANPDTPCEGPCGWTPLMRAACAGTSASASCRLLVLARADVRCRDASGKTALDMGDKDTSRAIREARDLRASLVQEPDADVSVTQTAPARASAKRSSRPIPPHLAAALASSLASTSKGRGRGTKKSCR